MTTEPNTVPTNPDIELGHLKKAVSDYVNRYVESYIRSEAAAQHFDALFKGSNDSSAPSNNIPAMFKQLNEGIRTAIIRAMGGHAFVTEFKRDPYLAFVKEAMRLSAEQNPDAAQRHMGQMMTFLSRAYKDDPEAGAKALDEIFHKLDPKIQEAWNRQCAEKNKRGVHSSRIGNINTVSRII